MDCFCELVEKVRVSLNERLYLSLLTVGLLVKDWHADREVLPLTPLLSYAFRFDKSSLSNSFNLRCRGIAAAAGM